MTSPAAKMPLTEVRRWESTDDPLLVHAHTDVVEPEAVDVRGPPGGNQQLIAAQRAFARGISRP